MKMPIVLTDEIKAACLQTDMRDENSNVKLSIAGWGSISTGGNSYYNFNDKLYHFNGQKCKLQFILFIFII